MPLLPQVLLLWSLGQTPPAGGAPAPAASPAAQPAPEKEKDTEHDAFVRAAAEKLDKIRYARCRLRVAYKQLGQEAVVDGQLVLGPNDRQRFEIRQELGKPAAKALFICDGSKAVRFREMGDQKRGVMVDLNELRSTLDNKEITPDERAFILQDFVPIRRPGAMLLGYLRQVTFIKREEAKLKDAAVVRLEGQWRKSVVTQLASGDAKATLEDFGPGLVTHVRLTLHKDTGWPVEVELYHSTARGGTLTPVQKIEFLESEVYPGEPKDPGKKAGLDKEFAVPAADKTITNETNQLKSRLAELIRMRAEEKKTRGAAGAGTPPANPMKTSGEPAPAPPAGGS